MTDWFVIAIVLGSWLALFVTYMWFVNFNPIEREEGDPR